MSTEEGLRERKKRETRHALRTAALRLITKSGIDAVTVQDIADAADVSARTFFNHFTSKEEAILGADPGRVEKLVAALADQPSDASPVAVLRGVLIRFAAILNQRREELLMQIAILHENPQLHAKEMGVFAQYERVLVQDVARRSGTDPDADLYPTLAAGAAVAALRAALWVWRASEYSIPLPDLVGTAFDQLSTGLAPPTPTPSPPSAPAPGTTHSTNDHHREELL